MRLEITIVATESYQYAMRPLSRAIQRCLSAADKTDARLTLVGDEKIKQYSRYFSPFIPVRVIVGPWKEHENYKNAAQLTIAEMRQVAFDSALERGVDLCWSIDSDVIPPPDALQSSIEALRIFGNYYSIAQCPYPSQGGGPFLGGHGSPGHPIEPDFSEEERIIPPFLTKARDKMVSLLGRGVCVEKVRESLAKVGKRINESPVMDGGNIWLLNAKKWRRRGWFDRAYPGIGAGSIVPIEWCGFGCTLMNKRALELADFTGYDGGGTEDLFVVWRRWFPADLRIAQVAHSPCSHIIRVKNEDGSIEHKNCFAYKEPRSIATFEGHLRQEIRPFHKLDADVKSHG